jgi:Alpha amylase, catalytic domain
MADTVLTTASAAPSAVVTALTRPPLYPALFQLNTRVRLRELESALGRAVTLDDIPDSELDHLAAQGFDWVYCLGVWSTGEAGREVSRTNPEWRREFQALLPDLEERDICGSSFAVTAYAVHSAMGGNAAMERLRQRLHARGLRLMLDFVPNHMAPDHPWVWERPELFVPGSQALLESEPANYITVQSAGGPVVLAHGRDPYFPGWPDTLQLDYGYPATQTAMRGELLAAASLCDGLRCDMAMLILPKVFQRTWGRVAEPFWPEAIQAVRQRKGEFVFMAEVYWGLESTLLQQGFDYAYDKTLYDRAIARNGRGIREHLMADLDYQRHLVRFLENHDEPRAAGTFPWDVHQAAAVLAFLTPGLRFFHQGQFEGRKQRVSIHLNRAPVETPDAAVGAFYARILDVLKHPALREGAWHLLEPTEAWSGNWTWDGFICFAWEGADGARLLGVVNFQPNQAQCYVRLPFPELAGRAQDLIDLLGPARYRRDGDELLGRGLYLDLPAWGFHLFSVEAPVGESVGEPVGGL